MSVAKISWSDIEVQGRSTGKYICGQYLNALLRANERDEAVRHKFIVQKCTGESSKTVGNNFRCLDMTSEEVVVENMSTELKDALAEHRFVVIEQFDAHSNCAGEDPPSIVITEQTTFYPVDFIDYK